MYKLAVLPLLFAVASAGFIGAPVATSYAAAPLAYSAPAVASYSTHTVAAAPAYAAQAYAAQAYAAPVAYAAPAVVKTVSPVATSYQNTYKISRSAVAVAPAVATYAAAAPVFKTAAYSAPVAYSAPAVATYAHAAPAVATYAHAPAYSTYAAAAPAYSTYAAAPAISTYAAAPALSYSAPLLKTAHVGLAAPALYH